MVGIDNIYVFRDTIEPKWEDPMNQKGCEY